MWMEYLLHTVHQDLGDMCGLLPVHGLQLGIIKVHFVPVCTQTLRRGPLWSLILWEITTSVRQDIMGHHHFVR